ncbi:PAS domain S-box protein [Caenimonas sedimenti]|uniref:PAS domain S-box protein n=1 Tax=Caenimonas sedimenti TaxID=2596921 RepID=A0A562ZMF7_9BURK|nr:PAS domain-containing protein [Caenimonas sedimenti]TWO69354.1 PAS domain S-box protein [Caenimonas sedimenti]
MGGIDHQQLIQAFGDAVVVSDPAGRIVLWNPAATRLFGFSQEEAMGQPLDLIIPERLRKRHNEGYDKTMATGETRYGTSLLKVPALHKDGRPLSIAFTVAMLTGPDGKVTGIAAVIRDETARFAEERALKGRVNELEAAAKAAS